MAASFNYEGGYRPSSWSLNIDIASWKKIPLPSSFRAQMLPTEEEQPSAQKPLEFDTYVSCGDGDSPRSGFTGFVKQFLTARGFSWTDSPAAIENCGIFIVVMSEDFASSPHHLDEVAKIVEFAEVNNRKILPVFYHMSPSDALDKIDHCAKMLGILTNSAGSFLSELLHPKAHKISLLREWFDRRIKAMKEGTDTFGWHINRKWNSIMFEYTCMEEILREVSKHAACTVGLHTRVVEFMPYLYSESDKGCVVGISGVAGIDISALTRKVYRLNACNKFDYCCLVDKAGEYSRKHGFECLLSEIVGEKDIKSEYGQGVLKQKKIFSIVEGIGDPKQLKAIVEQTGSLGSGSIVILAHDYDLRKIPGIDIDKIYEMKKFDNIEAYEFLCLKMFNSRYADVKFLSIIKRAAACGSGLPSDLESIGSSLAGKEKEECQIILDEYEKKGFGGC